MLRVQRTHMVQFPIGIQLCTFDLAVITLQKLDYTGPIVLSCDDTKLLPSVHPYFDKEKDAYFVLGHVGKLYQLVDPSAFEGLITSSQLEKATKVSWFEIFCISPQAHLICTKASPLLPPSATYMYTCYNHLSTVDFR